MPCFGYWIRRQNAASGSFCVRTATSDQPIAAAGHDRPSLAIALGANLPSPTGPPLDTLFAVRPLLESLIGRLRFAGQGSLRWSPLFRTVPVGGPPGQPAYLNAAVLLRPVIPAGPTEARRLLADLQGLERRFGRQRRERWGPRSLDLDLLWWGDLSCCSEHLALPHPRLLERSFVLGPLAAIEADLMPPGAPVTAAVRLAQLQASNGGAAPQQLVGCPAWPE